MDISIVIPTFNRKVKLKECLDSLFVQVYPKDLFEIIVIDDGSSDGTKDMLEALSKANSNLRYFIQGHKGPATARNLGIREARAEIIGFTDSDCILDKNWVSLMVRSHSLDRHIAAIGGVTEVDKLNIKAQVSQFLSDGAIETVINGKSETIFFPTCNVSFKRDYILSGFNEFFPLPAGEDLDFFWRLFKKGGRFSYNRDIKVFHNCHTNFVSFLKQAYMYGRGNYLVQHMHKDHPLLKEIKTQNSVFFLFGLIINFIKIPRFSCLLGRRLIRSGRKFNPSQNSLEAYSPRDECTLHSAREEAAGFSPRSFTLYEKIQVYACFTLHKINYLAGNIKEHIRMVRIPDGNLIDNQAKANNNSNKPEFIILDITHRCNLNCNICEIRKDKPTEEYTIDEVKKLINEAIEWQVREFVLSGGEPLIRDDIFEILDFVKEKKYRIGILTNGIILNEDFINKLLPYLALDTLSLSLSLDALTPEIHDEIRGLKGSFKKTTDALKMLAQLKKNNSRINFNSISIILNENLEELVDLAHFLRSLNINSIQFQPLLSNNLVMREREKGGRYWIPQDRLDLLDRVVDNLIEFKKNNMHLVRNSENNLRLAKKYFRSGLSPGDVRCRNASKTILIANNGDVTTCFDSYGNIRTDALREIFASQRSIQARKRVCECKAPCLLPCFCD